MTRTVFFGKATEKQKKYYEAVLESQSLAINFIKNNLRTNEQINGKDADAITREYLIKNEHTSMPHSLGHGIGLEVHESPRLTPFSEELLETGNVFSIEPGVYFPDKFGIRIEDIFAIEDNKLITLTKSPRHFIEII